MDLYDFFSDRSPTASEIEESSLAANNGGADLDSPLEVPFQLSFRHFSSLYSVRNGLKLGPFCF